MKKISLSVVAFFFILAASAQSREIDSLKEALGFSAAEDSQLVSRLQALAAAYEHIATDSSLVYAEKALAVATRKSIAPGISASRRMLGSLLLFAGDYPEARQNYQEALALDDSIGDQRLLAQDWIDSSVLANHMRNYADCLPPIVRAWQIEKERQDPAEWLSGSH